MTEWRLIDTGPEDAHFNMALDIAIAEAVGRGLAPATLRFYSWKRPSVSLGYFQSLKGISLEDCYSLGIPVVRRPTGGRAILHGREFTYSFSSTYNGFFKTNLYETYRLISMCFVDALRDLGLPVQMEERKKTGYGHNPLCFLSSAYGEVMLEAQKIMGSAQRRFRDFFLQQGSMPYYIERHLIKKIFNNYKDSFLDNLSGLSEILKKKGMNEIEEDELKEEIIRSFERRFNIKFKKGSPSGIELKRAEELKGFLEINKGTGYDREININLNY